MSAFIAVASREVRERSFVFVAAAAFAILPFIVAVLPFGGNASEKIGMLSGILSVGLALGLGVALGTSIIGRDLSSGKLSFYFTRPVGAASIWFGKLTAALVLVAGAFAISFAPLVLVREAWRRTWNVELVPFAAIVLGFAAVLMLVSHVVSTAVRSRSWLIAFDFVLLAVSVLLFATAVWPLLQSFAVEATGVIGFSALGAAVVAIIPAGFWQLSRGRADRFRSHRAMSTFLWAAVALIMAAAAVWSLWIRTASPSDLTKLLYVARPTAGNVAVFSGSAERRFDYHPTFVGNIADGRYATAKGAASYDIPEISADGSTMAFFQASNLVALVMNSAGLRRANNRRGPLDLYVAPTADPGAAVLIERIGYGDHVVLSRDGARLAILARDGMLSMYDTRARRLLFASRVVAKDDNHYRDLAFVSPDVVRVTAVRTTQDEPAASKIHVVEIKVPTKTIGKALSIPAWGTSSRVVHVSNGRDMLVRTFRRSTGPEAPADAPAAIRVIDAGTGATRLSIAPSTPGARVGSTWLLKNGAIATLERRDKTQFLRLLSANGALEHEMQVGNAEFMRIDGELPNGALLLYARRPEDVKQFEAAQLLAADPRTGWLQKRTGVKPVYSSYFGIGEGMLAQMEVPGTDANSRVVRWNPLTNAVTPIVWKKR